MVVWGVSVDTTIIHTFLSPPACTDMVYLKELECIVTTTAMENELQVTAPENLDIIPSYYIIGSIFLRPKDKLGLIGICHVEIALVLS